MHCQNRDLRASLPGDDFSRVDGGFRQRPRIEKILKLRKEVTLRLRITRGNVGYKDGTGVGAVDKLTAELETQRSQGPEDQDALVART